MKAKLCDTFISQSLGYMFRGPSGPFFFELPRESRVFAGIHMFFVFFPLQAVWLDREMTVVDIKVAKTWRLYWPKAGAKYLIETPAADAFPLQIGERLEVRYE